MVPPSGISYRPTPPRITDDGGAAARCGAPRSTRLHKGVNTYTKIFRVIWAKSKSVFLPMFSRKPNNFRGPGGFCWPIGVTTALLGCVLRSDVHKLVEKKERRFGPKSGPDRPLFFWQHVFFFKLVEWAVKFARANSNLTKWQAVKTSTTLDSDSLRKIPRARKITPDIPHSQLQQSAEVPWVLFRGRNLCLTDQCSIGNF
jgi:hypothetical protein